MYKVHSITGRPREGGAL